MQIKMEVKHGVINFDLENSVRLLLGHGKQIYAIGMHTANKIVDVMGFNTIIFHCFIISVAKDKGCILYN